MSDSLGLKADQVELQPYSPAWSTAFESEGSRLEAILGTLVTDIQHVGSTAVPGLPAKPIIDIAVCADLESTYPRIKETLIANGYDHLVDAGDEGGHIFYRETTPGVRSYHLHVIDERDVQWRNYLRFRNRMRQDGTKREEYARLKAELAAAYPQDRDSYTNAKREFIRHILREDS